MSSTSVPFRSAFSPMALKWELKESICEREWYSGIHRPVSDWADASESIWSWAVARRLLNIDPYIPQKELRRASCCMNSAVMGALCTVVHDCLLHSFGLYPTKDHANHPLGQQLSGFCCRSGSSNCQLLLSFTITTRPNLDGNSGCSCWPCSLWLFSLEPLSVTTTTEAIPTNVFTGPYPNMQLLPLSLVGFPIVMVWCYAPRHGNHLPLYGSIIITIASVDVFFYLRIFFSSLQLLHDWSKTLNLLSSLVRFGGGANNPGVGYTPCSQHTTADLDSNQCHLRIHLSLRIVHRAHPSLLARSVGAGGTHVLGFYCRVASCTPMGRTYRCFQAADAKTYQYYRCHLDIDNLLDGYLDTSVYVPKATVGRFQDKVMAICL